jgi:phosphoribosyl 1,2-cyclic phosphate phosphodiesterase
MDILVLGTAAAEAWPALFCHCSACSEARRRGGKDLRSRSGYMIGEEIKIDFGPDSAHHSFVQGLAYEKLKHLLVSHSHTDHWTPAELGWRSPGFSQVPEDAPLTIYGNQKVRARTEEAIGGRWEALRLQFVDVEPFQTVDLEPGIRAIPLRASHDRSEVCLNWMVEANGKRFLQAHDTGWWEEECWEFLQDRRLDAVVWDCTHGSRDMDRNHMGCEGVVRAKRRLEEQGSLAAGCRFFATHFSHNGGWLHEDLERFFAPHGIETAYDGLRIPLAEG